MSENTIKSFDKQPSDAVNSEKPQNLENRNRVKERVIAILIIKVNKLHSS